MRSAAHGKSNELVSSKGSRFVPPVVTPDVDVSQHLYMYLHPYLSYVCMHTKLTASGRNYFWHIALRV